MKWIKELTALRITILMLVAVVFVLLVREMGIPYPQRAWVLLLGGCIFGAFVLPKL